MLSTSELRKAWAPACNVPLARVEVVQGARVQCHEKIATAVRALGRVFEAHAYPVRASDTGAYNCRQITGGTGHSLHSFGIAIDVNWNTNPFRSDGKLVTDMPAAMIADVRRIHTTAGKRVWGWGGDYKSVKDAMHFEIVCSPAELAKGIDWNTVRQAKVTPSKPFKAPFLQRGDRGPAVEKLQILLAVAKKGDAGFGIYGPRTEAAVRDYQLTHGLEVDGRVGRQTWTALLTGQPQVSDKVPSPIKNMVTAPPVELGPIEVRL